MNKNDPAFPTLIAMIDGDRRILAETTPGLTKREWFAGMALQGLIAGAPEQLHDANYWTDMAFNIAESMLDRKPSGGRSED